MKLKAQVSSTIFIVTVVLVQSEKILKCLNMISPKSSDYIGVPNDDRRKGCPNPEETLFLKKFSIELPVNNGKYYCVNVKDNKLNKSIEIQTCNSRNQKSIVFSNSTIIGTLNKCCSVTKVYDSKNGACERPHPQQKDNHIYNLVDKFESDNEQFILTWFDPLNRLHCKNNMVTIKLKNTEKLVVTNRKINIDALNKQFDLNSNLYCVDIDSDGNLIIKFCDGQTNCKDTLCLQKCCKINEYTNDGRCVKFNESNLVFLTPTIILDKKTTGEFVLLLLFDEK